MSGGGGGSGGGGIGGPPDDGAPCDRLRFNAPLVTPNPAVVAGLTVGHVLDLIIQNQSVAALTRPGAQAAGYVIERLPQLLRCLQAGHAFEAEVLVANGGDVRVQIRPAGAP